MGPSKYCAFLSYSRKNETSAVALQTALEKLAKPWFRTRVAMIFRDKSDGSANPELREWLKARMRESSHFLLLASPESASSYQVQTEIRDWIDLKGGSGDRILIALGGGSIEWDYENGGFDWSHTTALSAAVFKGLYSAAPTFVDLRSELFQGDLTLRNAAYQQAVAELAAPLRGIDKRVLVGREARERRILKWIGAGTVSIISALALTAILMYHLANVNAGEAYSQAANANIQAGHAEAQRERALRNLAEARSQKESANRERVKAVKSAERERFAHDQADIARDKALTNLIISRSKTAIAEGLRLLEHDPGKAGAFAVRSLELHDSKEAATLLARAVVGIPEYTSFEVHRNPAKGKIELFQRKPRVRNIIVLEDGTIVIYWTDLRVDALLNSQHRLIHLSMHSTCVQSDENGRRLALCDAHRGLVVFGMQKGTEFRVISSVPGSFIFASFNGSGDELIAIRSSGNIARFDFSESRILDSRNLGRITGAVALTSDHRGCHFLVCDKNGTVTLHDSVSGKDLGSVQSSSIRDRLTAHSELELLQTAFQRGKSKVTDSLGQSVHPMEIVDRFEEVLLDELLRRPGIDKEFGSMVKTFEKSAVHKGDALVSSGNPNDIVKLITQGIEAIRKDEDRDITDVSLKFGPDDESAIVTVYGKTFNSVEAIDYRGTARSLGLIRGFFSKCAVQHDGRRIVIAGVRSLATVGLVRDTEQHLLLTTEHKWDLTSASQRIGIPRDIAFSPHGHMILVAHAPMALLQAVPAASVSLWLTETVDARDGDTHQGIQIRPHDAAATSVRFSPCGDRIVTYATDGTIRTWKVARDDRLFDNEGRASDRMATFLFNGYRALPDDSLRMLRTRNTFKRLIRAYDEISTARLSRMELKHYDLETPLQPKSIIGPAESGRSYRLEELIDRGRQIAVQNPSPRD